MKKILMTMVALLSMTVMVAQTTNNENRKPRKMGHEEMTTQMTSKLQLSDAQKTKVAALNKEYQDYLMPEPPQQKGNKQSDNSKAGPKTNKKANDKADKNKDTDKKPANNSKTDKKKPNGNKQGNSQNQAKRQEYEKKLKAILTDDQFKSYQKMGPEKKDK